MVDVLIVGAGACGLVAALRADQLGLKVVVLEKAGDLRGDSVLSCGSIPAANTRFQRQSGIIDSVELMTADLSRKAGEHEATHLVRPIVARSGELVEWLVDHCGVGINLYTNYKHVGHSVPRLHSQASGSGTELMDSLHACMKHRNIELHFNATVEELLTDASLAVTGARVRTPRGSHTISARKVILASGGFGANTSLLADFCPEMAKVLHFGAAANEGDAIYWGRALGAAFGNLGAFQAHAGVLRDGSELLTWSICEKGALYVNPEGRRFTNENRGYSPTGAAMAAQGNAAYVLFDQRMCEYVAQYQPRFKAMIEAGAAVRGSTVEELAAAQHAIPAGNLHETLLEFNSAAAGSSTDRFGRTDFGLAPLQPPYWLTAVKAALFHTQGGLMVDGSARVMRTQGGNVPNLFAGGGAAVGVSGLSGGEGYVSGNGLLTATVLGYVAAETAVREIAAC